jgi:hypothetical protein
MTSFLLNDPSFGIVRECIQNPFTYDEKEIVKLLSAVFYAKEAKIGVARIDVE